MRFLIAAAPDPDAPPAGPPSDELFAAYMKFNEELAKAGVLVASEGLNPGVPGARVGVVDGKRVLLDGPFPESKELVGGFYIVEVASREEAIEWALRCPVGLGSDDLLTVPPMTGPDDIPPEYLEIIRKVAPTWSASFVR